MIYVEGKNMPYKRFETLEEAEKEAERLCKKEKSMPISILFVVSLLAILTSIVIDFVLHIHLPLIYFGSVGLIIGHIVNHRRAHA